MRETLNGKGSIEYVCENCGEHFLSYPSRMKAKHICCSKKCMGEMTRRLTEERRGTNAICPICQKEFWCKPCHLKKYKQVCCSRECSLVLRKIHMSGEGNHQFGLKGRDNPTWKSDEKISHYGYRMIRALDHPFRNYQDWVFEHRLIAEKYLLNEENSVIIDGKRYLKKEYDVHHIDENRLNNNPNNLLVLTHGEHVRLHNKKNPHKRNSLGQYTSEMENNNA